MIEWYSASRATIVSGCASVSMSVNGRLVKGACMSIIL